MLESKPKAPAAALTYFPSSCQHPQGGCPPGELILQAAVARAQTWIPSLPLPLLLKKKRKKNTQKHHKQLLLFEEQVFMFQKNAGSALNIGVFIYRGVCLGKNT